MLVLTRKKNERINIGSDIEITLLEIRGNRARIGIKAPGSVRVMRAEIGPAADDTEHTNTIPLTTGPREPEVAAA